VSLAEVRAHVLSRHDWPGATLEQRLAAVQGHPQDARDYNITCKDVANLRLIHQKMTFRYHNNDAESLKQYVCCSQELHKLMIM
jgi:hypothetical protein